MEKELRFGLDMGRLAVLNKRVWSDYEQLLRVVFFLFSCFLLRLMSVTQKNVPNAVVCYYCACYVFLRDRH